MNTFPADAPARLTQSLKHTFRAVVHPMDNGQTPDFELNVEDISVTFDEAWSPHVQAQLTCALPDEAQLAALDPRKLARVSIYTGYVFAHEDEAEELLADLHLRSITIKASSKQMVLFLSGDEALLQDFNCIGTESFPTRTLNQLVRDFVDIVGVTSSRNLRSDFANNDFGDLLNEQDGYGRFALRSFTGRTAWDCVQDIADRCGVWVYAHDGVNWRITERPEIAAKPVHNMTVGEGGTVVSSEVTVDRGTFYNSVFLDYEFDKPGRDATGGIFFGGRIPVQKAYGNAFVTGGPFSADKVGLKTYYQKIDDMASKAQANASARGLLNRLVTKGFQYSLEGVALYTLRPGQTVEVQLEHGGPKKLLVKAVTFNPASGLMTVNLRQPEHSTIESLGTSL